ncbi:Peroxidase [Rhynchospora pubera]|uniref:Peroxidase n=1 Tax=Rhynchospora pubera TaxID=906938 RepID=A0AAV8HSQ2_9POAL|nr:Peroxidase [Rhynchospora pubera]KAJ4820702.1 Peroxidase [Rhynchospora pubera]
MAFFSKTFLFFWVLSILALGANAQLTSTFYANSCPNLQTIVRSAMSQAVNKEARMGASILRLFFHDCFVNGCDGSILLDDTSTFTGEKNAGPNANSARGFDVIDTIKSQVEASCKGTVSCADILALAARDGVNLLGGPTWTVLLGRRDAKTASQSAANSNLPGPGSSLQTLINMFSNKGLNAKDMTALSGAHTIGQARCTTFRSRIYGDTNINSNFAALRKQTCPQSGGDGNLAPVDVQTPTRFDNAYYQNLVSQRGLFHSDQELFNGGSQDSLVRTYSTSASTFSSDFVNAMIKMGNISPLTGTSGEIRLNCRKTN